MKNVDSAEDFRKELFGNQLYYYRKRVKLNQRKLAEMVGISFGYVTKFESGKQPPTFEICEKMTTALELKEEEISWFYKAAAQARLLHVNKEFLEIVGEPEFKKYKEPDPIKGISYIPVFSYPKTRIVAPYKNIKPISYYPFSSEIISVDYYAVIYKSAFTTNEMEFRKGDLLIINPNFEHLNIGDYVLVKLNNKTVVRKYEAMQDNNRIFINFLPYPPADEHTMYDPITDSDKFEIIGKIVYSFKQH